MKFITTIRRLISQLFVKESPMTDPVITNIQTKPQPTIEDLQARVAELEAEVLSLGGQLDQVEPTHKKFVELLKSVGHDVELVADDVWSLAKKLA